MGIVHNTELIHNSMFEKVILISHLMPLNILGGIADTAISVTLTFLLGFQRRRNCLFGLLLLERH